MKDINKPKAWDKVLNKMADDKDCKFDIYAEVKQLSRRLKKENCFYPWYIFNNILLNTHGWVHDFKNRELNESFIYDFVKNVYKNKEVENDNTRR